MQKYPGIQVIYPVDMGLHYKSQGFGENPYHINYKQFGLKDHNGDDYCPHDGQSHEVYAADDWQVAEIYRKLDYGYGYGVALLHKWGRTKYGHFRELPCTADGQLLRVGQKGRCGDQIGWSGNTGNSTALHVHFGVYPLGEPYNNGYKGAVDPTPYYITAQPLPGAGVGQPPVSRVKAGEARITLPGGVRLRLAPSVQIGPVVGYIYPGVPFWAEDEAVIEGNVVFHKVAAWVAESQDGVQYMVNLE